MAEFLEERLPIDVRMGATYADEYAVEITRTANGSEHRRLIHAYPVRQFTVNYTLGREDLWTRTLALYHRAYGMYAGFRVRCADDFSTNSMVNAPTASDHDMALVSAGIYQLQNYYGAGATPLGIGYPVRTIYKPVSGTVRVSVNSVEITTTPVANWSVVTTTGRVTFAADVTTGITINTVSQANPCVITYASAPPFVTGQSVHLSSFGGMTQLNNQRASITVAGNAVTLVGINSLAYSAWTSGGTLHTRPQAGESVKAGCEFDLPCRFNSRIDIQHISQKTREAGSIDIIELVAP